MRPPRIELSGAALDYVRDYRPDLAGILGPRTTPTSADILQFRKPGIRIYNMASRVLREGLLDSPKYWAAPVEAQNFFTRLILVADDFGCFNATRLVVGRRCFEEQPGQAKLNKLYKQLAAADLVRFYFAGDEKFPEKFGFIPKFRQTMRLMRAKHPMPPESLFADDADAQKKFSEYKNLFTEMPGTRTTSAIQMQGTCVSHLDLESNPSRNDLDLGLRAPVDKSTAVENEIQGPDKYPNGKGEDQGHVKGVGKDPRETINALARKMTAKPKGEQR